MKKENRQDNGETAFRAGLAVIGLVLIAIVIVTVLYVLTTINQPRSSEAQKVDLNCVTEPKQNPLKECAK